MKASVRGHCKALHKPLQHSSPRCRIEHTRARHILYRRGEPKAIASTEITPNFYLSGTHSTPPAARPPPSRKGCVVNGQMSTPPRLGIVGVQCLWPYIRLRPCMAMRLFPLRSDREFHICSFRSQKWKRLLSQSGYAKSDRIFFRFENPMAQVVRFWPKIRRLGPSDFQIEKWSLN